MDHRKIVKTEPSPPETYSLIKEGGGIFRKDGEFSVKPEEYERRRERIKEAGSKVGGGINKEEERWELKFCF